jgi:uncharacterized protein (DUF1810 family)
MKGADIKLEVFLYDTRRIRKETDDPRKAVLFSYPPNLTSKEILLHAGHLVALYQASKCLMTTIDKYTGGGEEDEDSLTASISTSMGNCQILTYHDGQFLILVHATCSVSRMVIPAVTQNNTTVMQLLHQIANIPDDPENSSINHKRLIECEKISKATIQDLEGCLASLFNMEPGNMNMSTNIEDLNSLLKAYFEKPRKLDVGISTSTVEELQRGQQLFAHMDILFPGLIMTGWLRQTLSESVFRYGKISQKEVGWLSLTLELEPSRIRSCQECAKIKEPSVQLKSAIQIFPLSKTAISADIDNDAVVTAKEATERTCLSLADKLRGLITADRMDHSISKDNCCTLYTQKGPQATLYIILNQCFNDVDQYLVDNLWAAGLTKLSLIHGDGDNNINNNTKARRRPSSTTAYYRAF